MADNTSRPDELREAKNPLFNDRKLRLGTFCSNLSDGTAVSTIEGTLKATWPDSLAVARLADAMEFEAQVPVARWKGFGGQTNFNGAGLETFTWAAGVAASTENSAVFCTSHLPTIHPIMAAKQATTIDLIADGRFALNVVTGWYRTEIEMFGAPQLEHGARYDLATEWLEIVKLMWTAEGEIDYHGKYFKVDKASMEPKPVQKPHPVIMNAAGSDRGRAFAAKYCDVVFVLLQSHAFEDIQEQVSRYRRYAREEFGRELMVWMNAYVVQGDSDAEANRFYEYFVEEKGDHEAAENLITNLGINSKALPPEVFRSLKRHFMAGYGGYPLVGASETVVDGLDLLSRTGVDGVLLSWPRYIEDMRHFQETTYPMLQQAGLR